jgi:long-chain fatty acid transport protein
MTAIRHWRATGKGFRALVTMVLAQIVLATGAGAQDSPQPILIAQFSFSNPGARSLGLGGAFVALADDATAAWANPAGLIQITTPEVSVEGRYWDYATPTITGGRVRGRPTGVGLDTVDGLRTETAEYDTTDLAFLSFVYPGNRWSVALYRHVLSNLVAEAGTQGLFSETDDGRTGRFLDQWNRSDTSVVSYGVAGAFRVTDSLSLGAGLVYYDTSIDVQSDLYFWDDLEDPLGSGTSYRPERFVLGQNLSAEDQDLSFSGGFLWRIDSHWSLGGRFRLGPEVPMGGRVRVGSALDLGVPPGTIIEVDFEVEVALPDNYSLGIAYRSEDSRLTVGFEWDLVTYSDPLESLDLDDQFIDDAHELHLGAEWVFLETRPLVAIRGGIWHDPDHLTQTNENADDFTRALLQAGEDQLHYSLGAGVAFDRFQLDGAIDYADTVKVASLSAIYSF